MNGKLEELESKVSVKEHKKEQLIEEAVRERTRIEIEKLTQSLTKQYKEKEAILVRRYLFLFLFFDS